MTRPWTHIRFGLSAAVLALALAACAGGQGRSTATPVPVGHATAAAELDGASAAPTAGVSSTAAADLNRKLLSHLTPPTEDSDLPLGPGDLIEISVFDVPEFSKLKVRIPAGGSVALPLIGAIRAAGFTPSELEKEVRTRLQQDYMNDPQVAVFVSEQKSQRISVIGAVRTGGVYTLTGRYRLAEYLLDPYVYALDATPRVALIPLLLLWFGLGAPAKIAIVFLSGLFPVLMNTFSGVRTVSASLVDIGRVYGAGEAKIFTKIIVPAALPFIMAGVRLAVGRALIGIITAEMFTAVTGMGALLIRYSSAFATDKFFVPVIFLALLGVILSRAVELLQRRLAPWKETEGAL